MNEVSYAKLHTDVFIPKLGSVPSTLTADPNGGKLAQVKMHLSDDANWLIVVMKGFEFEVPRENISFLIRSKKPTLSVAKAE